MPHESQVVGWPGRTLFDADGSKVGKIEDVFADERTGRPAWATVSSGLFGRRHHFVPIENAREVEDGVAVPVPGQLVKGAPNVAADGDLSHDDERTLYRHYGMDDGDLDGPGTATAPAVDADGDGRDDRDDRAEREEHRESPGYAHHDERTHRDADGDDRAESGGAAAGRTAATGGAHRAGAQDTDLPSPDDRDRAGDEARGPGVPPALQADATTEAAARAERERLAAEEAEHDRLTERQEATPTAHESAVLDRELAQQDLSVTPVPSREEVADDRDRATVPGPATTPAGRNAPRDAVPDRGPGTPSGGTPGAGTRLRRLVRSITPSKDDSHG